MFEVTRETPEEARAAQQGRDPHNVPHRHSTRRHAHQLYGAVPTTADDGSSSAAPPPLHENIQSTLDEHTGPSVQLTGLSQQVLANRRSNLPDRSANHSSCGNHTDSTGRITSTNNDDALAADDDDDEKIRRDGNSPPLNSQQQDSAPDVPSRKLCPSCGHLITTLVEFQTSPTSCLLAFLIFILCGWISICILPFAWPLLQTSVHTCPICCEILEKRSRLSCFKLRDEIVTIRIGTCAVVLSRRYVLAFLVMLSLIATALGLRWYLLNVGLPDIPKGPFVDTTWEEFLSQCGTRTYLGNPLRAEHAFEQNFYRKTVTWEGRVHQVQEGLLSKHFLYVDMSPPQYARADLHDIALIFGKSLRDPISAVDVGDLISFEATLLELGKRGRPHLGILWNVSLEARKDDIPPLIFGPRSPFFILRDRLGPFDIPAVVHKIRDVHREIKARQRNQTSVVLFGGEAPMMIPRIVFEDRDAEGEESEETNEGSDSN